MEFLDNQTQAQAKPQYDDTNTGMIMANNQRTKETHPNCRGRANIEGVWYWVSGWNKMSSNTNERFVSLAYTRMTDEEVAKYVHKTMPQQGQAQAPAPQQAPVAQAPVQSQAQATIPQNATNEEVPF